MMIKTLAMAVLSAAGVASATTVDVSLKGLGAEFIEVKD